MERSGELMVEFSCGSYVMDEGTSHVDAETEQQIMHTLRKLSISCIFVTHNRDILKFADKVIYWSDSGKPVVTEMGSDSYANIVN